MKNTLQCISAYVCAILLFTQASHADVSLHSLFPNLMGQSTPANADGAFTVEQLSARHLHDIESFTLVDLPQAIAKQNLEFTRVEGVIDERTIILHRAPNGLEQVPAPTHSLFVAAVSEELRAVMAVTNEFTSLLIPSTESDYVVIDSRSSSQSLESKNAQDILNGEAPWQCFTSDFPEFSVPNDESVQSVHSSDELLIADIALELDSDFFRRMNKDPDYEIEYITNVYGMVNVLYGEYVNVQIKIRIIDLWLDASIGGEEDPYSGNDISKLLEQFRDMWNISRGGLKRTLAQLVSSPGSTSVGGIAYRNTLCRNDLGYSVVGIRGSIDDFPVHNYVWDVMVVAHEVGHNFSSPHTHDCEWGTDQNTYAIDSCVSLYTWPRAGDACTPNSPRAKLGTIMSYCHLNSMGSSLVFHPEPAARIRSGAERANCMSTPDEPSIYMLRPLGRREISAGPIEITWSSHLVDDVHIFARYDGEETKTLLTTVSAHTRSAIVDIPADKESVVLRIESTTDGTLFDETWGELAIKPSNSVEESNSTFSAYYNSQNSTIVVTSSLPMVDVVVYDISGAERVRLQTDNVESVIPVEHLPVGMYIVRSTSTGVDVSKKILITH